MSRASKYSPEVRERAVRMVFEHQHEHASQWAAMESIAAKIGCTTLTSLLPERGTGALGPREHDGEA